MDGCIAGEGVVLKLSLEMVNPCPDGHEARAITLLLLPREVIGDW